MELLYALETIRTPLLDALFGLITRLGEETALMIVGMVIIWCVDKKWGFRFLFAGLVGTGINQLLKAIFLIPRPWVIDPEFEIVESAREAATGYSFPSGHTQSAATVFGMIAVWMKRRGVTAVCAIIALLVGFSRMYLGVHTPLDVGVSLVTGFLTVAGMTALFDKTEGSEKGRAALCAGVIALAALLLLYVSFAPKRAANNAEFDAHGVKNAYSLLGGMIGMVAAYVLDEKKTHYETKAVWWVQVIKLAGGFALVLAMKEGLKPILSPILGGHNAAHAVRYALMTLVGAGLWPMAFGPLGRLGKK